MLDNQCTSQDVAKPFLHLWESVTQAWTTMLIHCIHLTGLDQDWGLEGALHRTDRELAEVEVEVAEGKQMKKSWVR